MADLPSNTTYGQPDALTSAFNAKAKTIQSQYADKIKNFTTAGAGLAANKAKPAPTGFGSLDSSQATQLIKDNPTGPNINEPAVTPGPPQAPTALPTGTKWDTSKDFLGQPSTPPPAGTKSYALSSGIGGRTITGMSSTPGVVPDLHQSTRGNQPAE